MRFDRHQRQHWQNLPKDFRSGNLWILDIRYKGRVSHLAEFTTNFFHFVFVRIGCKRTLSSIATNGVLQPFGGQFIAARNFRIAPIRPKLGIFLNF